MAHRLEQLESPPTTGVGGFFCLTQGSLWHGFMTCMFSVSGSCLSFLPGGFSSYLAIFLRFSSLHLAISNHNISSFLIELKVSGFAAPPPYSSLGCSQMKPFSFLLLLPGYIWMQLVAWHRKWRRFSLREPKCKRRFLFEMGMTYALG